MKTRTITAILALAAGTVLTSSPAAASDGCTTVDYQGAPTDICPPPVPDPTNCYTGWYQGAPIEVCLPTGDTLPEGTTYNGEPVVMHVSVDYVAPVAVPVTVEAPVAAPIVTISTYFDK